jgi:hypothetical protein
MDEEETTRGDDDKKISCDHSYEVLVESFDYTIVAFEPMMSVYFRPHERERGGKRVFIFVSNAHFCG